MGSQLAALELGLSGVLTETLTAWTWQDFRIAGAPKNVISLALDWQAAERFGLNGDPHWVPVDNMNTVFNLGARYAVSENAILEVTNLFDRRYAAPMLARDPATAGQAAFIPGVLLRRSAAVRGADRRCAG
ncbi:hypothetical protein [Paenirhodobacter sp.]|uniref:hypothetical protein n=1 Tax=Paenirhodobacter sp. TaxID=1965326 RepID=UPI003B423A94